MTQLSQLSCKVIKHSISPVGAQIATLQLRLPRFLLAETNTHKAHSLSAGSSRAIPTARLLGQVVDDPFVFTGWRKAASGMQPAGPLDGRAAARADDVWREAAHDAAGHAQLLMDMGVAKEQANRLLEPFLYVNQVVTATNFSNMRALRCHPDAQAEFHALADLMIEALELSTPTPLQVGDWHLPYVLPVERGIYSTEVLLKVSAARCARVSYTPFDADKPDVTRDLVLFDKLIDADPPHISPACHQARALANPNVRNRNFKGWLQFRALIEERGFAGMAPKGVIEAFI